MKKVLNIIIICIILIGIFFTFDYIQYKLILKSTNYKPQTSYLEQIFQNDLNAKQSYFFQNQPFEIKKEFLRNNIYNKKNNTKNSILIFGCSFASGWLLEDKDTFSNQLAKNTGRNVYNLAFCATGIQHMYHFLRDEKLFKYIDSLENNPPEYTIYIYIPSHMQRISSLSFPTITCSDGANLIYDLKDDKLVLNKPIPVIHRSYLFKKLLLIIDKKNNPASAEMKNKNLLIANKLFIESKKILQNKYPNMKFVILYYDYKTREKDYEPNLFPKSLEKEGFIVIDSKDLIGRTFTIKDTVEDNFHPNAQAWEELIPPLIKELEL